MVSGFEYRFSSGVLLAIDSVRQEKPSWFCLSLKFVGASGWHQVSYGVCVYLACHCGLPGGVAVPLGTVCVVHYRFQ